MMFEIRSPTKGTPVCRANWSAIASPTSFDSAYDVSGRGGCVSSIGAKAGGSSNGRPEDGLARCPHDPADAAIDRGREHVVRRHRVVPERLAGGPDVRGRDRGEMDDGVGAGDDFVALAEVGQVGQDALAVRAAIVDDIDVEHGVAGLAQLAGRPIGRPCRCHR